MATWRELGLSVTGPASLAAHLAAEYGPPDAAPIEPDDGRGTATAAGLVIGGLARPHASAASAAAGPAAADRPADRPEIEPNAPIRSGGHKTTRWRYRLGAAAADPLRCELEIRGLFGNSLAQSIIVEPLVSVALARREVALLSAAAVDHDGTATVLIGGSRSGKSTLAVRAWSLGREMLADDRLFITPDGRASGFRRRLRVYPDLRETAPDAFAQLRAATRRRLRVLGATRRLTAGWVGLPALIPSDAIQRAGRPVPIGRLVVIQRAAAGAEGSPRSPQAEDRPAMPSDGQGGLVETDDPALVWRSVAAIIERDLRWVAEQGADWGRTAEHARETQLVMLRQAIGAAGAPISVLSVPASWDAPTAIQAVSRHLGFER